MRIILIVILFLSLFSGYSQSGALQVNQVGNGTQDLIFLPGFGCSPDLWNETIEELKDEYTCHKVSIPGFAGVPAIEEEPMYTNIMEDLYYYVKRNNLNNPVVIGHSIGGHLALFVETAHPGTWHQMIIVDALPFVAAANDSTKTPQSLNLSAESMSRFYKSIGPQQFETLSKKSIRSMIDDTTHMPKILNWYTDSDPYAYGYLYGEFIKLDLRQEMHAVDCPVLLLVANGFEEQLALEIWNRQYRLVENKTIKYNANANHFMMYDDFDWTLKQIEEFLE